MNSFIQLIQKIPLSVWIMIAIMILFINQKRIRSGIPASFISFNFSSPNENKIIILIGISLFIYALIEFKKMELTEKNKK